MLLTGLLPIYVTEIDFRPCKGKVYCRDVYCMTALIAAALPGDIDITVWNRVVKSIDTSIPFQYHE